MTIAILGCGPAGLMAAHAAAIHGEEIMILSNKRKSYLNGAQYLHEPIPYTPSAESTPVHVKYQIQGDVDEYRLKVYGPKWDGTASPEELDEDHAAWDIRETYDWLWDQYSDDILDVQIGLATLGALENAKGVDLVISSIPARDLCVTGSHTFGFTEVFAAGDAPGLGTRIPYDCAENTVVCNGEEFPSWYRLSNIYGHRTVEWPGSMRSAPPVPTAAKVVKPTFNNCSCNPGVLRVGRYGAWTKGVLSHSAFNDVMGFLS